MLWGQQSRVKGRESWGGEVRSGGVGVTVCIKRSESKKVWERPCK